MKLYCALRTQRAVFVTTLRLWSGWRGGVVVSPRWLPTVWTNSLLSMFQMHVRLQLETLLPLQSSEGVKRQSRSEGSESGYISKMGQSMLWKCNANIVFTGLGVLLMWKKKDIVWFQRKLHVIWLIFQVFTHRLQYSWHKSLPPKQDSVKLRPFSFLTTHVQ